MKRTVFVVAYPFQFFVLYPIYKACNSEAEFVVDLGAYFPISQPESLKDEIVELLEKNKVRYRVLSLDDYRYPDYLKKFFSDTGAIVSLWERGVISLACNLEKIKIQVTYGAGKELNMVRPSRAIFDLILSYGPRDHALASMYTTSVIVGNPKFDPWFSGTIPALSIEVAKKINSEKKTVVYLPTHGDLSSLEYIATELTTLSYHYNVIAKPHYLSLREEVEKVDALRKGNVVVVDDRTDLLSLLQVADAVLSDNSSVIFDAILADVPLVVADFWDAKKLDVDHRVQPYLRRGRTIPVTYSGSIEQEIKRTGKIITFSRIDEMKEKVDEALNDGVFYKEERKKIRDELFAFNDGACAVRAAVAIQEFCLNPRKERPVMYHALEAFKENIGALSIARRHSLERVRENLTEKKVTDISLLEKPVFTVCVFSRNENSEERTRSLRALFSQSFPSSHIRYLFYDVDKEEVEKCLPPLEEKKYDIVVRKRPQTGDELITDICKTSVSKLYAFTTLEYMVPSSWLLSLWNCYEKEGNISGAGGVNSFERENTHPLQSVEIRTLQKKWNVHDLKNMRFVSNMPSRNPAGDFSGVSYRRSALEGMSLVNLSRSFDILSEQIKMRILAQGESLAYVPVFPVLLTQRTWEKYIYSMIRKGFISHMHRIRYPYFLIEKSHITTGLARVVASVFASRSTRGALFVDAIGEISRGIGECVAVGTRYLEVYYPHLYDTALLKRIYFED